MLFHDFNLTEGRHYGTGSKPKGCSFYFRKEKKSFLISKSIMPYVYNFKHTRSVMLVVKEKEKRKENPSGVKCFLSEFRSKKTGDRS